MSNDAIRLSDAPTAPSTCGPGGAVKILSRVSLVLVLIAVTYLASNWFQRRAVWSVIIAGGTVSSIHRDDHRNPGALNLSPSESNSTVSELVEDLRNVGCPADDRVFGVNLSHTNVGDEWLSRLGSLRSLEFLALDARQVGPGLARLGGLPSLRLIKIFGLGERVSIRPLLALPHLEELQIVNPRGIVRDFALLGQHPSLRQLEFEALDPTAVDWARLLEQCRDWSNIENVLIRSQFTLSPGIEVLRSCASLTTLELSAPLSHLDFVAIGEMRQLTKLVLNAKKIQGSDLLRLGALSKMRTLKIYSHGDHESELEALRQLLPNCDIDGVP